jgi:UDP-N-acetylglucosamine 2-epimerase (non-hydrolysing)
MFSHRRKTILCVIGTRPEAIKMAPLVKALERRSWVRCRVLLTGQHRELVDQMLAFFAIKPDIDLALMRPGQSPADLVRRLVGAIRGALAVEHPAMVLAQGDTSSVLAAALASFLERVPFGHVEAGLRSHRLDAPYPEEANRVITSHLSAVHFAPTHTARADLVSEGIAGQAIHVCGNTVIDALLATAARNLPIGVELDPTKRLILVTVHRRESFGEPLRQVCMAVERLHDRFPDVEFLWPLHPNPSIGPLVQSMLSRCERIRLAAPLAYGPFVSAMKRASVILTDSGGIQEEAPALGKPVLVLRNESERREAIALGVAKLVGYDPRVIFDEAARLFDDAAAYRAMANGASPYGDGRAADRIASILGDLLGPTRLQRRAASTSRLVAG